MEARCKNCDGCVQQTCGNCRHCARGRKAGCIQKRFAGPCQNPPQAKAPRRDPAKRSAAAAKAPPPKARSQWSDDENTKAKELYDQGTRDRTQFGKDLHKILSGNKSEAQCASKYSYLKKAEQKAFYVFAYDPENPTQHSLELIAALPKADRNLGEPEIERRWWAEVEGKGKDKALNLLKDAIDHAFNYFGGDEGLNGEISHMIKVLAKSGLPPSFLELNPPKRNTKDFRRACDQFQRETFGVRRNRDAALGQLMGDPMTCTWGFLLPGQDRSDTAKQQEMARRAVLYACVGDGANPATQMPKVSENALIKASTIKPPYEPVAPGATHATDSSYARREPA